MNETLCRQFCWCNMNSYVGITANDGQSYDGFIAFLDQEHVTLAIPSSEMFDQLSMPIVAYRQFGYHAIFLPRHHFRRHRIPFNQIQDVYLLPFSIS